MRKNFQTTGADTDWTCTFKIKANTVETTLYSPQKRTQTKYRPKCKTMTVQ